MTAQSNAQLAQEIYSLFSNNQLEAVLAHCAEDIEIVFMPTGQVYHGHSGMQEFMDGFKGAFPDVRLLINQQLATDNGVVTEFNVTGTHTGTLKTPAGDIPPTGRSAEWPAVEVWRVKDGRLVSLHNYQDLATMLRQLGLMG